MSQDLNDLNPLYTPDPEYIEDYISIVVDHIGWLIEPMMFAAILAIIIIMRKKEK